MEGVNVTTIAGTFAQLSMLGKIKAVTLAIKEQAAAFLATPIGAISAIALGIFAVVKVTDALTVSATEANEKLEKTAQEVADLHSEQESLNNELETTRQRIAELKAQGTLTFTEEAELTRLQKENAELERKLELTKANKAASKSEFEGDFLDAFDKNYGDKSTFNYQGRRNWLDKIADALLEGSETRFTAEEYTNDLFASYEKALSGDKAYEHNLDKYKERINDVYEDYQGYLKQLEDADYSYGTNEQIDAYIDQINEFNDKYLIAFGNTENLFAQIVSRDKFTDGYAAIKELGNVTQETLSQLYNENEKVRELINYLMGLGTVDWKTILGDDKFTELDTNADGTLTTLELFDQTTGECKVTSEQFSQAMSGVANELNKVEEAAEEAETSFKSIAKTLSDGLDKLSNKKDILSEVKKELDSFGAISADNISKILEQFSDNDDVQKAVAYYLSGIGTAQQLYDVMAQGYQNDLKLQAQELATKMQNDEKYYEAIGGLNNSFTNWLSSNYDVDLKNCTTLAKTKLEVENSLINTFKENWGKYYKWVNNISSANINSQIASIEKMFPEGVSEILFGQGYAAVNYKNVIKQFVKTDPMAKLLGEKHFQDLYAMWLQLKDIKSGNNSATKELDKLISQNFSATGFNATLSTDFDKGSGKTAAEKYFDELKYKLETNQITQEKYLKDLDWGYKHFYNKTADYLEDYAKYSQEVYDGFKDMYKEDLEAQKEAWEEKKDAVSEYYDNLREQIKDAHDEEDYEKEQSEKRKEIFDLDMQIAELMRDGSEKAKARIAELEEERLKAEEELLDFETDKAREDELSRLEKEQKAEEDKIQAEIDAIDEELRKIDGDIVSGLYDVRKTIVDYAAKQGITLDFAYASGTRSSVGGFGRINEKGIEMISAPDGNGNYIPMLPNSYVFSAKATEFLWKLATEHSLPQAMYNSIAKSIKTQSSTPSVNIAQPITITMGDVIIKGNADKQTVADIKRQQENTVRMVLQKIKELQK